MNFFKSILTDDDALPEPEIRRQSDPHAPLEPPPDENNPNGIADGWSFGGLIRSLSMQSESVIEIYRRDLKEFGSGIRKETEVLRETASRAVKDLPASLEAAHGALDGVLKSTANIISKESLGFSSDGEPETPGTNRSLSSGRYNRFEAQLSAIQNDLNAFCEEPEDVEDYGKWKLGFELGNYRDEIDSLIGENGILDGVYKRAVPSGVDREIFWCRYFYRVDKLKQQESVRANLVRRAIAVDDEEEELSWDVDDDEEDDDDQKVKGGDEKGDDNVAGSGNSNPIENKAAPNNVEEGGIPDVDDSEKMQNEEQSERDEKMKSEEEDSAKANIDEKVESGKKGDNASMVEDVGWDEIEDTGSDDKQKISAVDHGGSPKKDDIGKRLSSAEDEDLSLDIENDDLSWDIEDDDDDEPAKA